MAADPWFSSWNYHLLRTLFSWMPHGGIADDVCNGLLLYPLLSTWVFAACFYRFWTKDDEQRLRRQRCLGSAVVALGIAGLVTLILRPWIHWPAPVLNPHFEPLFARESWGNGSANCFPSHSTLAYFMIAVGFWPLNRGLSLLLSTMALLLVSFPRVYVGGHYPVDVLFSCLLGVVVFLGVWRWPALVNHSAWPVQRLPGALRDLLLFLWVFELGEGFRSVEGLFTMAHRAFS